MDIISRLNIFFKSTDLTLTGLSEKLNIPKGSLSQILSGRNQKISNEVISKLHTTFPTLNIMWVLFGEGSMRIGETHSPTEKIETSTTPDYSPGNPINNYLGEKDKSENDALNDERLKYDTEDTSLNFVLSSQSRQNENQPEIKNHTEPITSTISEKKSESKKSIHSPRTISKVMIFYNDYTVESFDYLDKN